MTTIELFAHIAVTAGPSIEDTAIAQFRLDNDSLDYQVLKGLLDIFECLLISLSCHPPFDDTLNRVCRVGVTHEIGFYLSCQLDHCRYAGSEG